ncbi:DUF2946 family protein [Bosea sp. 117]|uniref:DUF2946 family protein n=1 Tax=Bosea sp. 117 TaxID=1125973 RepID=UPI00056F0295|nr:DUF2946 family protein [Bosea sp. 117]
MARSSARMAVVAIFAAYLVVLQSLLGGLATGAHAGAASGLDAFGQIICRDGAADPQLPSAPDHHVPDCCGLGCQLGIGAALPTPAVAAPVGLSGRGTKIAAPHPALLLAAAERSPRNARAPPAA